MATGKPKLRQRCVECGFTIRRVWPTTLVCSCGGTFALAPREWKLSPTERLHISILGHCVLLGMCRGDWSYTKVAEVYGVDRKTVLTCMERHPLA